MDEQFLIKTILVVEDDRNIGEMLLDALQEITAYQIILAVDSIEALTLVKAIKPVLCLLDYNLPGMNGIALYDHIHTMEGLEHARILLMSANLPEQEMEERDLEGIQKPFDLDNLAQIIEKFVA